jgi:hypothetical protein
MRERELNCPCELYLLTSNKTGNVHIALECSEITDAFFLCPITGDDVSRIARGVANQTMASEVIVAMM